MKNKSVKRQEKKLRMALALGAGFMILMIGVLFWMQSTDSVQNTENAGKLEWRTS